MNINLQHLLLFFNGLTWEPCPYKSIERPPKARKTFFGNFCSIAPYFVDIVTFIGGLNFLESLIIYIFAPGLPI